ncbi:MAG: hypothetical protein R3F28_11350 [Candidatus Kapaibacterium sp.]
MLKFGTFEASVSRLIKDVIPNKTLLDQTIFSRTILTLTLGGLY